MIMSDDKLFTEEELEDIYENTEDEPWWNKY